MKHWLFEPVRHLAEVKSESDRGISLLMLELAFFEPLGSILLGKESDGNVSMHFVKGLSYFAEWMYDKQYIKKDVETILRTEKDNLLYKLARCGLMHQFTMKGGNVFVSTIGGDSMSVLDYKMQCSPISGRVNDRQYENLFLVNPWKLLPQLEKFLDDFVKKLDDAYPKDKLYKNFKKTFERTIVEPGKVYCEVY